MRSGARCWMPASSGLPARGRPADLRPDESAPGRVALRLNGSAGAVAPGRTPHRPRRRRTRATPPPTSSTTRARSSPLRSRRWNAEPRAARSCSSCGSQTACSTVTESSAHSTVPLNASTGWPREVLEVDRQVAQDEALLLQLRHVDDEPVARGGDPPQPGGAQGAREVEGDHSRSSTGTVARAASIAAASARADSALSSRATRADGPSSGDSTSMFRLCAAWAWTGWS